MKMLKMHKIEHLKLDNSVQIMNKFAITAKIQKSFLKKQT